MPPLMAATEDELKEIHEVGPEVARSIVQYFGDDEHLKELRELLKV